jgi:RNA 2',3'-cyclic 3'-phosphodiesterase
MRLFVAAELPGEVRDALAGWARFAVGRGAEPRRVEPHALHVTLCFLGEQPPSAVDRIAAALRANAELVAAVDGLRLGAPVWLPPRTPRVLAVEVADPGRSLHALRDSLLSELGALLDWQGGGRRERFRPHVTVARMRAGSQRARVLPPTPPLGFAPTAATLFRSSLEPQGARYEALASVAA